MSEGESVAPATEGEVLGMKPRTVKIKQKLKVDLTDAEMKGMSNELVDEINTSREVEAEKKAVVSTYKSKLDSCTARIGELTNTLRNGYEFRDVECELQYHEPAVGLKRVIRLDTLEVVDQKDMTDDECQEVLPLSEEEEPEEGSE